MKKLVFLIGLIFVFNLAAVAQSESKVLKTSKQIFAALKAKNFKTLATFVHPAQGLYFAPFVLDLSIKKKFGKTELPNLFKKRKKIYWGQLSEGDEDSKITKTFATFYDEYFQLNSYGKETRSFYNISTISLNTQIKPQEEITKNFPKSVFVEFNAGLESGGNQSLYLIFQKFNRKWYLVCVSQISQNEAHYAF